MNKRKIYLDTSVIIHLDAKDNVEKQQDTVKFFDQIKKNEYIIVVSDIVFDELSKCPEPKLSALLNCLKDYPPHKCRRNFRE